MGPRGKRGRGVDRMLRLTLSSFRPSHDPITRRNNQIASYHDLRETGIFEVIDLRESDDTISPYFHQLASQHGTI